MIATGIFLFLLGTRIGQSSAIKSEVKYEGPSKATITEKIDQSPISLPDITVPAVVSNHIHQGSNYFFGPQVPPGFVLPPVEKIVTKEENDCSTSVISNSVINTGIIVGEQPSIIEVNPEPPVIDIVREPKLSLPIPNISVNLQPIPKLPSIPILDINSQLISKLPLPSVNFPGLPLLKRPIVPVAIPEPIRAPGELVISEIDLEIKKIPPPPVLPPLIVEEIIKPVVVEEKKIILIPSLPEIRAIFPPSVVITDSPCQPALCAQNIVFERVLPNIACENTKLVELISIPAAKRPPIIKTSVLPFLKK